MVTVDLAARLACVARTWTPRQRLHVGNVAWAHARGDGSTVPDSTLVWGAAPVGFADIWAAGAAGEPATAVLHLPARAMTARELAEAVDDLLRIAPRVRLEVSLQQPELVGAVTARGLRACGGPWFAHLWRSLADLSDLAAHPAPAGYTIRPVRPDELADRVELHRRCWAPARIKRLLGLPVTGEEAGSGYSLGRHRAVMAAPPYRGELDMVAVAPDGSPAAFGLGWLDAASGAVLFEPVGTVPEHAGRGLGRAVCAEILRAARDLGATQAVVGPRGDRGYPVPRRLYEGLRMREVARIVSFATE